MVIISPYQILQNISNVNAISEIKLSKNVLRHKKIIRQETITNACESDVCNNLDVHWTYIVNCLCKFHLSLINILPTVFGNFHLSSISTLLIVFDRLTYIVALTSTLLTVFARFICHRKADC